MTQATRRNTRVTAAPVREPRKRRQVPRGGSPSRFDPVAYLLQHLQAQVSSLGRMARDPLPSLITAVVLGIALALPSGMFVLLQNAEQLGGTWGNSASISLFLEMQTTEAQALEIAAVIESRADVANVSYVSRSQALADFRRFSGLGDAVEELGENPLPPVLVVEPATRLTGTDALEGLVRELERQPAVALIQLDMEWIQRLHGLTELARQAVLAFGALLGLAVLLIVGNTIRLIIENRREEIVVMKLVGGTDAFVRRPFLYTGAWFGLLGGLIAWLLIALTLWRLQQPVQTLAILYQSGFVLKGMSWPHALVLLGGAVLLGLGGAWLAVGRHMRAIEPE